jgi:hypothetical protein
MSVNPNAPSNDQGISPAIPAGSNSQAQGAAIQATPDQQAMAQQQSAATAPQDYSEPSAQMQGQQPQQPPKTPPMLPAILARHIATILNNKKRSMAQFMADSFGLPRGIIDADEETLVTAWLKRKADFDVTEARLMGISEDEIADKAYPLRRPLVNIGRPTWQERVDFANKMAELAQDPKYSHLHENESQVYAGESTIPTDISNSGPPEKEESSG